MKSEHPAQRPSKDQKPEEQGLLIDCKIFQKHMEESFVRALKKVGEYPYKPCIKTLDQGEERLHSLGGVAAHAAPDE